MLTGSEGRKMEGGWVNVQVGQDHFGQRLGVKGLRQDLPPGVVADEAFGKAA